MNEFLHMGGYAPYVWPSMGLGILVLVFNVVVPLLTYRAAIRKASDFHAAKENHGAL